MDLNRYTQLERIGEGTYGVVYKATDKKTKKCFAFKKIALDKDSEGVPSTCIREIALLKELNHINIVRLYDVIHVDMKLYLVFEFVDSDLKGLLDKLPGRLLPPAYVKSFVFQLLQALAYCHTHRVIHRDLKPQNLLVDRKGTIKLADFGLARNFSMPSRVYTHEVVTLWYRAPEVNRLPLVLLGARYYSTAIDIWSLACIIVEMAWLGLLPFLPIASTKERNLASRLMNTGKPLFEGDSEVDQLFKIFKILGTPNDRVWPGVANLADWQATFPVWDGGMHKLEHFIDDHFDVDGLDLVFRMLLYYPETRITAKSAISHRYLREVPMNLPSVSKLLEETRRTSTGSNRE